MSAERLLLSDKYKAFLRCDAPVEFLEGTTAAGKTTVGLFKFMLKVAESPNISASYYGLALIRLRICSLSDLSGSSLFYPGFYCYAKKFME